MGIFSSEKLRYSVHYIYDYVNMHVIIPGNIHIDIPVNMHIIIPVLKTWTRNFINSKNVMLSDTDIQT